MESAVTEARAEYSAGLQQEEFRRLESAGRLAANVAHDFNDILAIIQGYTSLLLAQRNVPPEMTDPLRQIADAAERATDLTRQLLAFSRKENPQMQALNVNELAREFEHSLRPLLGRNILHQLELSKNLPAIEADRRMIGQVIMNLAVNARDAMPGGGILTLKTLAVTLDEAGARDCPQARAGEFVRIDISDTGAGMDEETRGKLFEPFFTTKRTGMGMGLATVHGIVGRHHGWIEVESREGVGSTFHIYLPAVRCAEGDPPRDASTARGGSETILVVEDEPVVRELAARQLKKLGYRVLQASSGAEALAIWPDHSHEIDLLFTDLVMPDGMTGRELAETLLAQKSELRVVYTSGYSLEVVEQEFALRKGAHFLQKPYPTSALARMVRKVLDAAPVLV